MTREELMNKKQALADYLNLNVDDITVNGDNYFYTEYETPDGEVYWVMDDTEADQAVYEYIDSTIDELGIYDAFTPKFCHWIENYALDEDFFSDLFYEDFTSYAEELQDEYDDEYGTRLNAECVDLDIIDDSEIVDGKYTEDLDLVDEYANTRLRDLEDNGDFFQEYRFQFGDNSMKTLIQKHPEIIDVKAIADEAVNLDGRGHFLSVYDGEELELNNDYYAYRNN